MKNYSFLVFTILLSIYCPDLLGQGLQFEMGLNDDYQQEIVDVANKNEFSYLLVRYDYSMYLEKYDSLGNRLTKQAVNPGLGFESFQPHRMLITNDGNIWISGFGLDACDVAFAREHVVVYDENCQFINGHSKITGSVANTQNYLALSSISDTSVAVNYRNDDSSWVEILSPQTQSILSNVNTPDLFGFGKNSQFHVLGHTINKIYGIDNQGILQDSITLPGIFREIGTWNDTIIVLGYNKLYKVTPDLQSYTEHLIPNLSNFTRLKINSFGVRFLSGNFNIAVHYLNHNLDIQSLTVVPVFDPNNTTYNFDQTLTVAKNFALTEFESVRMANYSINSVSSNFINRSDIAVLGIQIVDSYADFISAPAVYTVDAKANVMIKNVGLNVVDSVRLNHLVNSPIFCGYNVTSSYFSNLNLAPGDSVWVDFGWMGQFTANYPSGGILERQYCVYSSNPNGIVDLNILNDESCEVNNFGFVGLSEKGKIVFSVYPNPTNDILHVDIKDNFDGNYSIMDQMGRKVQSGILSPSLSLSNIEKGIYYIAIFDKKGETSEPQMVIKN